MRPFGTPSRCDASAEKIVSESISRPTEIKKINDISASLGLNLGSIENYFHLHLAMRD
jgi:hypothetical protein